jgi:hypothetical protein
VFIKFGKYRGKSVESLLLTEPDYAAWICRVDNPTAELLRIRLEIKRLVERFDLKRIVMRCQNPECREFATRCSVYYRAVRPKWWCDKCDPYLAGATPGKLEIIRSYWEVVWYVNACCDDRKMAMRRLVKELARAKGLPTRAGDAQAIAFFRGPAIPSRSSTGPTTRLS